MRLHVSPTCIPQTVYMPLTEHWACVVARAPHMRPQRPARPLRRGAQSPCTCPTRCFWAKSDRACPQRASPIPVHAPFRTLGACRCTCPPRAPTKARTSPAKGGAIAPCTCPTRCRPVHNFGSEEHVNRLRLQSRRMSAIELSRWEANQNAIAQGKKLFRARML